MFIRLTPRELALLALTCRAMNYIVGQYLQHYTASFGLKSVFRRAEKKSYYRVTMVVTHLGWVDLDLGCSTLLLGSR